MAVYARKIEIIKEEVGLSQREVADIVGASSRTVARWASGESLPRGALKERILELAAIADMLRKVMTPDAASAWLFGPNPLLGHRRPLELIRSGEYQRVIDAIDAIAEGVYV